MKHVCVYLILISLSLLGSASAQTFVACVDKKTDKLVFRARCRSSETKISTRSALQGAAGANGNNGVDGAAGQDGSLRIYGDGSAGPLSLTGSVSFTDQHLKQWTDCSIASGVIVTVSSGTVLRCNGSFTNNGSISVFASTASQFGSLQASSNSFPSIRPAGIFGIGWGITQASNGQAGSNSSVLSGGSGGFSMAEAFARTILRPGPIGGGAGGTGLGSFGAGGGGSLTILAAKAFVNNGAIVANGADATATGGGGGAGGVIILASKTSFSQSATGTISANGGAGATFSLTRGPGGGGGGGLIHALAPSINDSGSRSVTGGSAGMAGGAGSVSAASRSGGGSGGSCAGGGGAGGAVNSDDSTGSASAGSSGLSLSTVTDPTSLL